MADLAETTGARFLGLTLSCCRCHDHKYDPLSQADHYRLRAFFEPMNSATTCRSTWPTSKRPSASTMRISIGKRPNCNSAARRRWAVQRQRLRDERTKKLTDAQRAC